MSYSTNKTTKKRIDSLLQKNSLYQSSNIKYKKGGKLSISSKTVSVDPPQGYHWMEEQGRYYLMKGDYKPHPGAVAKAKFKTANHAKSN